MKCRCLTVIHALNGSFFLPSLPRATQIMSQTHTNRQKEKPHRQIIRQVINNLDLKSHQFNNQNNCIYITGSSLYARDIDANETEFYGYIQFSVGYNGKTSSKMGRDSSSITVYLLHQPSTSTQPISACKTEKRTTKMKTRQLE